MGFCGVCASGLGGGYPCRDDRFRRVFHRFDLVTGCNGVVITWLLKICIVIAHDGFILEVAPMRITGLWMTLQAVMNRVHRAYVSKYETQKIVSPMFFGGGDLFVLEILLVNRWVLKFGGFELA